MVRALSQNDTSGLKVTGPFDAAKTYFISARIEEGLSQVARTRLVIAILGTGFSLDKLLGQKIKIDMKVANGNTRSWRGTCIEAEFLGTAGAEADGGRGYDVFALELRAWPFFLMLGRDNRIFQDMTAPEIVKQVCSDHGYADVKVSGLSATYRKRVYMVQYDETDYDFVSRLMEEEGIWWFIDHTTEVETLVLADSVGAAAPIKETPELTYTQGTNRGMGNVDKILGWADIKRAVATKATLVDYNFTMPGTSLAKTIPTAGKPYLSGKENYGMSGRYFTTADAEHYATVVAERQAHPYERWLGSGTVRTMAAAGTFKLKDHPRVTGANEFLVIQAEHRFQLPATGNDAIDSMRSLDIITAETDDDICMIYENRFEVILKTVPYRPPALTPWPDLSGVHTAVVTGPSGEEIHTDKYGRIKVQFHWDRKGNKDEKTTCWVQCMRPWTGKNWGMISIPRIGQEVVISFERNNPDRPICVGMVYNETNLPPYTLPDNMTQTGIKTNSSKGGGGFNELVFEDKKGSEFVRLQSEKDYFEIIKNNATITIGLEKKDAGTLSEHVHGNVTEKYDNNHTYTLAHNLTETVTKGDVTRTLKEGHNMLQMDKGDDQLWLKEGFKEILLNKGDFYIELDDGNLDISIQKGDILVKQDNGKMVVDVSKSIEFKTGSASLTMKSDGTIEIKGKDITIDGTGNVKVHAAMNLEAKGDMNVKVEAGITADFKASASATLDGGGMTTVKGGLVKIN